MLDERILELKRNRMRYRMNERKKKKLNKTKGREKKFTMYSMYSNGIDECISSQERLSIFYEPTDQTNKLFHEIYVLFDFAGLR